MWLATYWAAVPAAIVLSSAVPTDPPSCCRGLTLAEATSASGGDAEGEDDGRRSR